MSGSEPKMEFKPKNIRQLILYYFTRSEQRASSWLLIGSVIGLTLLIVGMALLLNRWFNDFYNALQDYDKLGIFDLVWVFIFLASVYLAFAVYQFYLQQILSIRWRRWLTFSILNRWLDRRAYYYMENFDPEIDNPDQRICEDIRQLVDSTLGLLVGLLSAITTLIAFLGVLWQLSGSITIPFHKLGTWHLLGLSLSFSQWGSLTVPGYLVFIAFVYALIGTLFTFKIGFPLIQLRFEQQRREANFRFSTINVRTHAEHIALYRGEDSENTQLRSRVNSVLRNWYRIVIREKLLLWFTAGYNQIAVLLPLLAALPNYLSRAFRLGGLMQTLQAFGKIHDSLSYLVDSYTIIAEWRAVIRRLTTLLFNLDTADNIAEMGVNFHHQKKETNNITVNNLSIEKPDGTSLLKDFHHEFQHGHHTLIRGQSGIGKTTLIRVIAEIWPFGSGDITLPKDLNVMYIPQKSYMPLDTLKNAITFPQHPKIEDKILLDLLQDCHLGHLQDQLHQTKNWAETLSPGEQQRLAFARIILQKPDWLCLDECTSSVDTAIEKSLYTLLKSKLPHCSYISIGHRDTLQSFHDKTIDFGEFAATA
jgi:putative ATP-binding cassette transporter